MTLKKVYLASSHKVVPTANLNTVVVKKKVPAPAEN
jgi:hypothetical protein